MYKEKLVKLKIKNIVKSFLDEALTPTEIRLQLAKGLIPMETRELVSAFYYSLFDSTEEVRAAAQDSINTLPDRMLHTYLGSQVPGDVLNYFSIKRKDDEATLELILLNKNCPAKTLKTLAPTADEKLLHIIADNQQKIIEDPEIIDALEQNPNAHVSLIERLRAFIAHLVPEEDILEEEPEELKEFAMEDMLKPVPSEEELEHEPEEAVEETEIEEPEDYEQPIIEEVPEGEIEEYSAEEIEEMKLNTYQRIQVMSVAEKIQEALKGNKESRSILIKDTNKLVSSAVVKSPKMTENEVVKISSSRNAPEEVLRIICNKKEWVRNYQVKYNLITNPKTPQPVAIQFMSFLRKKDLETIGKSKMVPSIIATTARKLAQKRRG